jgi:hypothetical protein
MSVSGMNWSSSLKNNFFFTRRRNAFDESCRSDLRLRADFSSEITRRLFCKLKALIKKKDVGEKYRRRRDANLKKTRYNFLGFYK